MNMNSEIGATMKKIIELTPQKKRNISPTDFLSLSREEKRNIKACRFVPPSIGSDDFGYFDILLKYPTYTAVCNGETE